MRTNTSDLRTEADRIETLHPTGKRGVRIERAKYKEMRRAILRAIPRTRDGVPLSTVSASLASEVSRLIFQPGCGLKWYLIAVKQDLEARGLIEIVPGCRPQLLRRVARRTAR